MAPRAVGALVNIPGSWVVTIWIPLDRPHARTNSITTGMARRRVFRILFTPIFIYYIINI
jgi:hypothetical protein